MFPWTTAWKDLQRTGRQAPSKLLPWMLFHKWLFPHVKLIYSEVPTLFYPTTPNDPRSVRPAIPSVTLGIMSSPSARFPTAPQRPELTGLALFCSTNIVGHSWNLVTSKSSSDSLGSRPLTSSLRDSPARCSILTKEQSLLLIQKILSPILGRWSFDVSHSQHLQTAWRSS